MKSYSWAVGALMLVAMTAVSASFMVRSINAANQKIDTLDAAKAGQMLTLAAELPQLYDLFSLDMPTVEPPKPNGDGFMLGVHEGFITVFFGGDGQDGIMEVTATPVSALPHEEWTRLIGGIQIESYEQLSLLLQDYGS